MTEAMKGVEYFSHDTNASGDEKIELLTARYGNDGYAMYFITLERIYYSSGCAITWHDQESYDDLIFILSRKCRLSAEKYEKILKFCLRIGLFCPEFFGKKILTSQGVQRRASRVFSKRLAMAERYKRQTGKTENVTPPAVKPQEVKEKQISIPAESSPVEKNSPGAETSAPSEMKKETSIPAESSPVEKNSPGAETSAPSEMKKETSIPAESSPVEKNSSIPEASGPEKEEFSFLLEYLMPEDVEKLAVAYTPEYLRDKLEYCRRYASRVKCFRSYYMKSVLSSAPPLKTEYDRKLEAEKLQAEKSKREEAEARRLQAEKEEAEKSRRLAEFERIVAMEKDIATDETVQEFYQDRIRGNATLQKMYAKDGLASIIINAAFSQYLFEKNQKRENKNEEKKY